MTATRTGQWVWPALAVVLGAASVLLAAQARDMVTSFHQRTAHLCDGTIPLPGTAFALTWAAVLAGIGAMVGALLLLPRRRMIGVALVLVTGVVLVSAAWTTVDIHRDTVPMSRVCGG